MTARVAKRERPIIFSAPMVRVLLAGTKKQTRRAVKPTPSSVDEDGPRFKPPRNIGAWHGPLDRRINCPYGKAGDVLWVRETWRWDSPDDPERALYAATPPRNLPPGFKWKPSIHMPRAASRIELTVASVRAERLQEISEADARAEGCAPIVIEVDVGGLPQCGGGGAVSARDSFKALWQSLNAERAPWDSNPYVWVIEFERTRL